MTHRPIARALTLFAVLALAACGFRGDRREPWRAQEEAACFARGDVQLSSFIQERSEIDGRGICGIDRPLVVSAFLRGSLALEPKATLNCPETARLDQFMARVVMPAAQARFGTRPVAVLELGSYGCRTRNNEPGAKISEHAFGNALDVAGFRLEDGRHLRVKSGWRGDPDERAFWRDVEAGACDMFRTVLGPGSDGYHEDHLHMDLMRHDAAGVKHYCNPKPERVPPTALSPRAPFTSQLPPVPASRSQTATRTDAPNPFDPARIEVVRPQPLEQLPELGIGRFDGLY